MPTTYLLNTAILTAYGTWRFDGPLSAAAAGEALRGGFLSAVGHEATARFLEATLGLAVPVQRIAVAMQAGDRAVVFRLTTRVSEGRILTEEEIARHPHEFGLLTRLA